MDAFDHLLSAFGGRQGIAAVTGAHPNAVTQWRAAGVPFKHWLTLLDAAKQRDLEGVNRELLERTRPARVERSEAA